MEPRSNASSLDVDWETEFFYAQTRAEEMSHDLVYKFSIMEGVAGLYGNTVIYQAGNSGSTGTGPGNQVESGSFPVSEFQGNPALPSGTQIIFEKALFPCPLDFPADGQEDRN